MRVRYRDRRAEEREFRLLLWIAIAVLLPVTALSRLLPRGWRADAIGAGNGRSIYAEARDAAHTLIPYAFMG
jgi:hypothetical protein